MQVQYKSGAMFFRAVFSAVLMLVVLTGQSWGQSNLTLGHQVLLEKGLQLKTLAMPTVVTDAGGMFDFDLYLASGFNTIDLWSPAVSYDSYIARNILPGMPLNFARLVYSSTADDVCSATWLPNLVSIQLGDEQSIVSSTLPALAAEVAALKAKYPNAMVYTNQSALYHEDATGTYNVPLTSAILNEYVQTVKPDMLSFTEYPFRFQGTGGSHDYLGGSPTEMYKHIELYRKAGLAGLDGTGSQPIPVSMFVQTFAHVKTGVNGRQPTESEFRLQQFAGWAAGMKSADAFLYLNLPTELDSMFFEGSDEVSQTPTPQFYQYAELNRQSANLGDSLVRLISTDFRMKMGSHGTGAGVTNTLPSGVSAFNTTTDPYLTSISATNLGTLNNGLPGDVLYGAFKPLDPSLVEVGSENDNYFMIVNGLSDATGMAVDCRQQIHLNFDFSTSGIDSLLRLSRETGQVETVPLVYNGGSLYSLNLTLDGGTGDLFKYNTGSAFIAAPVTAADEPATTFIYPAVQLATSEWVEGRHLNLLANNGLSVNTVNGTQAASNNGADFWHAGPVSGGLDGGETGDPAIVPVVAEQALVYDFRVGIDLDSVYIWNMTQTDSTSRGVKDVEVYVSTDNDLSTWTSIGVYTLDEASNPAGERAQLLRLNQSGIQAIKFDILTAQSGEVNDYVGLSKIRFAIDGPLESDPNILRPTAVTASSYYGENFETPQRLINGSGFQYPTLELASAAHASNRDGLGMWHSGMAEDGEPLYVADQFLIFDLGANYDIAGALVWQMSQFEEGVLDLTGRGVDEFDIYLSTDDNPETWTLYSTEHLAKSSELTSELAQEISILASNVRMVKFDIQSCHSGLAQDYVGLSEVRFLLAQESPAIPGDANRDGKVDGSDVTILAGNWQVLSGADWGMGDFNGDGKVDGSDVTILAGNWQSGVTTAAAAVPEPSTLMLLTLASLSLLALRRKLVA